MAFNDVRFITEQNPSIDVPVQAAATHIYPGMWVKRSGQYAVVCADGDPVAQGDGTSDIVLGVAVSESSETSTDDGYVSVSPMSQDTIVEMNATTPANIDTRAEINALINSRITINVVGGVQTIDENAGDNRLNCLRVVGGDPQRGTLFLKLISGVDNIDNIS